jgi:hypothetical protein
VHGIQLGADTLQMQAGDLLVEVFGQHVYPVFILPT